MATSDHARCRILRLCRGQWLTAKEIRARLGGRMKWLPRWLAAAADERVVRMRSRKHEMREDGTKPPGQWPREYKVHTDFVELT